MENEKLQRARELISAKEYRQAREILTGMEHPTAVKWLQKLDEIELGDPFDTPSSSSPYASSDSRPASLIYLNTVRDTLQSYGWEMDYQYGHTYGFSKRSGPARWVVILLTLCIGLIGAAICSAIKALGSKSIASFEFEDDYVRVQSPKISRVAKGEDIRTLAEYVSQSVSRGVSHTFIWGCGFVSWVIGVVILTSMGPRY